MTAKQPKITIVTPSFNSIHTIKATLDSGATQDYPHVEHIVVDGGSTAGTIDILKSYPRLISVSEKDECHYHAMDKGTRMATDQPVAALPHAELAPPRV